MDKMASRLKKKFLEDIDEEVPEEYSKQREDQDSSHYFQTGASFNKLAATSTFSEIPTQDPLEQIESSIQQMMSGIVAEI